VQGKDRRRVLRNFCWRAAECEQLRVIKVEQSRLLETNVYVVTKGNHSSSYALQYKKKFYVSTKKNDFKRFLKNYRILAKPNFSDAFLDVYRYFKFNDAAINPFYIVDENYLTEYADDLKRYEAGFEKLAFQSIHPPQMSKADDGKTKIEFYADNSTLNTIMKITATLSSKYRFQEDTVMYRLEKPETIN
jgi:hypothetical protein